MIRKAFQILQCRASLQANADTASVSTASTLSDPGVGKQAESPSAEGLQSLAVSRPKRRQATRKAYKEESDGEWEADWKDEDDVKVTTSPILLRPMHCQKLVLWIALMTL